MNSLSIIIKIRKIVRSINLESKKIQKDFGISIPQLLCLEKLKNNTGHRATHGEVMKFLSLNSSTVTGIINRLELKGYVARLPSPIDRRVTHIALTEAGLKLLDNAPNILHDKLAAYLDTLPDDSRSMIVRALDMIIQSMEIENIDASPLLTIEEPIDDKTD